MFERLFGRKRIVLYLRGGGSFTVWAKNCKVEWKTVGNSLTLTSYEFERVWGASPLWFDPGAVAAIVVG